MSFTGLVFDGQARQKNQGALFPAPTFPGLPWPSSTGGGSATGVPTVINITDSPYNGKADSGVTDNTAALTAAVAALPAGPNLGGIIYFPGAAGFYGFTGEPDLHQTFGVILMGAGAPGNNQTRQGSVLSFSSSTGTGANSCLIDARSTYGLTFEKLALNYSNASYTGFMIDASHGPGNYDTGYFTMRDCTIGGYLVNGAARLVSLDKAIICNFYNVHFGASQRHVGGRVQNGGDGSYSNAVNFFGCTYDNAAITSLSNAGNGWRDFGGIWEGTNQQSGWGCGAAYLDEVTTASGNTITFYDPWMADAVRNNSWITVPASGTTAVRIYGGNIAGAVTTPIILADTTSNRHFIDGVSMSPGGSGACVDLGSAQHVSPYINISVAGSTTGVINWTSSHNPTIQVQGGSLSWFNTTSLSWLPNTEPPFSPGTTAAAEAAAGSTATLTTAGLGDVSGRISLTPSGSGIAAGEQVRVTFGSQPSFNTHASDPAPRVILMPENAAAAQAQAYITQAATFPNYTSWSLNVAAALTSGTLYKWAFLVLQ